MNLCSVLAVALMIAGDVDRVPSRRMTLHSETDSFRFRPSIWNCPAGVNFLVSLALGDARMEQVFLVLGEPDAFFFIGWSEYLRYDALGIDFIFHKHSPKLSEVRLIPPRIDPNLPGAVRADIRKLQGLWEEVSKDTDIEKKGISLKDDRALSPSYVEFAEDRMTLCGGGVGFAYCYRLSLAEGRKAIQFYLTDPEVEVLFKQHGMLPPEGIYSLEGDTLKIRFDSPPLRYTEAEPAERIDSSEDATLKIQLDSPVVLSLRRVRTPPHP